MSDAQLTAEEEALLRSDTDTAKPVRRRKASPSTPSPAAQEPAAADPGEDEDGELVRGTVHPVQYVTDGWGTTPVQMRG